MAKKKRKYLKEAAEAVANVATVGVYDIAKRAGSQMKCERKGGKWVKGKCIPGSQIRTGKKKYMDARPPGQTYLGRKRSFDPGGRRRES